jgi:hypothetical protein
VILRRIGIVRCDVADLEIYATWWNPRLLLVRGPAQAESLRYVEAGEIILARRRRDAEFFRMTLFKQSDVPLAPDEAAKRFTRARVADVETMLHQLEGLGIVRELETGKFTA